MSKLTVNRNKLKNSTKEDLLQCNKEELIDRILQLEAHNYQLKQIIAKKLETSDKLNDCDESKKKFDFSTRTNRRILLRIAYFGKQYRGLAIQEDCTNTIENYLFYALQKSKLIPSRNESNYHRCGRTDKGVSASGQVISLTVRSRLSNEELSAPGGNVEKELPYCKMLNRLLPDDIRVVSWMPIGLNKNNEPFSARFDCVQRTYKYWFPKLNLNIDAMREASKYLIGSHDFRNLCKMDVANGVTEYIRHIHNVEILPEKNKQLYNEYDMFYLKIVANAFLWHQIRCIAGVLFLIGCETEDPTIIQKLLDIENNPRKPQYNMAIDLPLNLFHCSYDIIKNDEDSSGNCTEKNWWCIDLEELEMVIKCFREQWTKAAIEASMIKDVVVDLEKLYNSECKRLQKENELNTETDAFKKKVFSGNDLLQGVKSKTYIPLLKRQTCETLENRIEHYVKKKRLNPSSKEESLIES